MDAPGKEKKPGHQSTSSGIVNARICPKAWAPCTTGGAPTSNTKKHKAIIANTKTKELPHRLVLIARSLKPK